MTLWRRLDHWIHNFMPVTAVDLAVCRIFYASFFLFGGIPVTYWIGANPPAFFSPPLLSVAALLGRFPPMAFFRGLDILLCALLIFLLVGFRTKATSLSLSAVLIAGNSFRYSFGKIDHDILMVLLPAVMAFSGWGAALSLDAKRTRKAIIVNSWPLALLALLVAFGFFTAGLPKFRHWVDFDLRTQGARSWLVDGWYHLGRRYLLAPMFIHITNRYFWEIIDLTAVTFEMGFLFTLWRRTWFRAWLFIAVMFHLVNLLMLNISFAMYLPVYFVFVPWERLRSPWLFDLHRGLDRLMSRTTMFVLLGFYLPLLLFMELTNVDTPLFTFSPVGAFAPHSMASAGLQLLPGLALLLAAALFALLVAGMPRNQEIDTSKLPPYDASTPIVFFDGVCNLCNGYVDFIIRRLHGRDLRFASLQSELGRAVWNANARTSGLAAYDTILFMEPDGKLYERADAVLKCVATLGGRYRSVLGACLIPRVARDLIYRMVSRSRFSFFGRRTTCRVPTLEERRMFL